jgi:hypothetical protein
MVPVQALLSSQLVPSSTGAFAQPVVMSQESVVQLLLSSQSKAAPLLQEPARQESLVVQTLESSQVVPSAKSVLAQPVAASQVSSVQSLLSLQSTVAPPQDPAVQTSLEVHRVPSSHPVPSATFAFEHPVAASQESVVQSLLSSQLKAEPLEQVPA